MTNNKSNLGSIAIFDVSVRETCPPCDSCLNNSELLEKMCSSIIEKCNLTILNSQKHQFEPYGLTCLYLLAESHLAIHTWPENNNFSLDVHSCNSELDTNLISSIIEEALPVKELKFSFMKRGV
jgi:S-adenosylmethionine decarboxylase proenzyme